MAQPNKLEMGIIKFIIARIKSKSPTLYTKISKIAGWVIALSAAYISVYNLGLPPCKYTVLLGQIDNYCIVIGAAATALGFVSMTTTTDPTLLSQETKANVLSEAVDNGTHIPISSN